MLDVAKNTRTVFKVALSCVIYKKSSEVLSSLPHRGIIVIISAQYHSTNP